MERALHEIYYQKKSATFKQLRKNIYTFEITKKSLQIKS